MSFKETYNLHHQLISDNKLKNNFHISLSLATNNEDYTNFSINPNKNLGKFVKIGVTENYIYIDIFTLEGNWKENKKIENKGYPEFKKFLINFFKLH